MSTVSRGIGGLGGALYSISDLRCPLAQPNRDTSRDRENGAAFGESAARTLIGGSDVEILAGLIPTAKIAKLLKAASTAYRSRKAAKAPSILKVGEFKLPGVPKGVAGKPVHTGRSLEYKIPSGTPELDPRVTHVRVMDPVTSGRYQHPSGYAVYMNKAGQTIDPLTGQTIGSSHPFAHIPLK